MSVPCTPNPVFDDRRVIALALTPSLTAHLRTAPLRFIVFDDDERVVRATGWAGLVTHTSGVCTLLC